MLDAALADFLGDVDRTDGAEQLALGAGLHLDLEHEPFELLGARLRGRELRGSLGLELRAPRLELGHVRRRGQRGLALRDQVIPSVAGLHAHAVADAADVIDFLRAE